jgi:hypothetical protein
MLRSNQRLLHHILLVDALDKANERADALSIKLEQSEKAREKAERDAASVEDLRKRLQHAENALSDKVTQQIAHENAIIGRLESQNWRFVSKFLLPSFSLDRLSAYFYELDFCSSRKDGRRFRLARS